MSYNNYQQSFIAKFECNNLYTTSDIWKIFSVENAWDFNYESAISQKTFKYHKYEKILLTWWLSAIKG